MNILKSLPWDRLDSFRDKFMDSSNVKKFVYYVNSLLKFFGVPDEHIPDGDQIFLFLFAIVFTLVMYWYWLGNKHHRRRRDLEKKLKQAQLIVRDLEEKLESLEALDLDSSATGGKEIRVWMDGAFDMMHYGHMNAFRLGRALGTHLIVGVNSDETITKCKGPPVMNDEERMKCVEGCKFVDEVVSGVPYIMNEDYIKFIIEKYKIDYIVHGDDPCIVDGKDVYEAAQKMGKYLTIPRTEGISTTDIVGRMLLMTRSHHSTEAEIGGKPAREMPRGEEVKSNFLVSSRIIRLFGAGVKAPPKDARIVYAAGSFDMFHSGHVSFLQKARSLGDYLIVGVHRDSIINNRRGCNLPIMTLHERVLSVLGCKYADDVLIDAPFEITQDMINSLQIQIVATGTLRPEGEINGESDPYALPRKLGLLRTVTSDSTLTALDIVSRIFDQRQRFENKFAKKKAQEDEYYRAKYDHSHDAATPDKASATVPMASTAVADSDKSTKSRATSASENNEDEFEEVKPKKRISSRKVK